MNNKLKIAVITISDRVYNKQKEDLSGPVIVDILKEAGFDRIETTVIPDERNVISKKLSDLSDSGEYSLVLTTGGTGLSPRDVTPEATIDIADRVIPGITEAIRSFSMQKTKNAMLSRGVAVQRGSTLIINIAGSPGACSDSMEAIIDALPHAIGIIAGEKLDK